MSPVPHNREAGYDVPVLDHRDAERGADARARTMARALEMLAVVVPAPVAVLGPIDRRLNAFSEAPVVARAESPALAAELRGWRGDYLRGCCRDDPVAPHRWADRQVAVMPADPAARPRRGERAPHPPASQAVVYVRDRGRLVALAVLTRLAGDAPMTAGELERLRRVQPLLEEALAPAEARTGPLRRADLRASGLSAREAEVAGLAAEGATNAEIASQLCISVSTVKAHMRQVLDKLGLRSRAELAARLAGDP